MIMQTGRRPAGAGHFLQEDHGPAPAAVLAAFIAHDALVLTYAEAVPVPP